MFDVGNPNTNNHSNSNNNYSLENTQLHAKNPFTYNNTSPTYLHSN